MTKYFAAKLALITFVTASTAFAAPPARDSGNQPCTHCAISARKATAGAATRGTVFDVAAKPCHHIASTSVRWGVSQKPCPHCSHSA